MVISKVILAFTSSDPLIAAVTFCSLCWKQQVFAYLLKDISESKLDVPLRISFVHDLTLKAPAFLVQCFPHLAASFSSDFCKLPSL